MFFVQFCAIFNVFSGHHQDRLFIFNLQKKKKKKKIIFFKIFFYFLNVQFFIARFLLGGAPHKVLNGAAAPALTFYPNLIQNVKQIKHRSLAQSIRHEYFRIAGSNKLQN